MHIEKQVFDTDKENICVMFSGGYDSTLLLIKALELKKNRKISQVYTIYIDCPLFPNNEKQTKHMHDILSKLRDKFGNFDNQIIGLNFSGTQVNCNRIAIPQLLTFLPTCLLRIPDNTEIWFGMIDDRTISEKVLYSKEKAMKDIIDISVKHFIDCKNVSIRCPILGLGGTIRNKKAFIIDQLLSNYKYIFDKCFSCDEIFSSDDEYDCMCSKHIELLDALIDIYQYTYNRHYNINKRSLQYNIFNENKGSIAECEKKMKLIHEVFKKYFPSYFNMLNHLTNDSNSKIIASETDE